MCKFGIEARQIMWCGQVTNTPWGDRVIFLFDPNGQLVPKSLHVSPFMDMRNTWKLKASKPSDSLKVSVHVSHSELGDYFDANLCLQACETTALQSEKNGFITLWRYALLSLYVAVMLARLLYVRG